MSRLPELPRLMYVSRDDKTLSHADQAGLVCSAGCRLFQLRMKNRSYEIWKAEAEKVKQICDTANAFTIINDSVPVTMETGCTGVHLGKSDMDPAKARELMGSGFLIGATANTFEDIKALDKSSVNYIGLGPYRHTLTKENLSPVLGIDGISEIMNKCREEGILLPVFAIGGIRNEDINALLDTGIYGIAVSSAILDAADKTSTLKEMLEKTKEIKQ